MSERSQLQTSGCPMDTNRVHLTRPLPCVVIWYSCLLVNWQFQDLLNATLLPEVKSESIFRIEFSYYIITFHSTVSFVTEGKVGKQVSWKLTAQQQLFEYGIVQLFFSIMKTKFGILIWLPPPEMWHVNIFCMADFLCLIWHGNFWSIHWFKQIPCDLSHSG